MTPADYSLGAPLDFLRRLRRLEHALELLSNRMERRFGVTAQQRLVLRCIGKYPGMMSGQLAAVAHLDPGTISSILRRLERRKLIERRRDLRDQRRVTLVLTDSGRELDVPASGTVEHAADELLDALGPAGVSCVATLLDRFADLVDAEGR